jgi:hypothetical protein
LDQAVTFPNYLGDMLTKTHGRHANEDSWANEYVFVMLQRQLATTTPPTSNS